MKDDLKRNSVKLILSLIILVIASIAFIFLKPESMASRFKLEYESLNGQKTDDGREYMEVNINNDNKIVYADYKTIFDVLDGTGVIYFGFPECPWCRNAVPILLEAAEESGIKQIYYLNNHDDRDTKVLKDGEVITENEGTSNYNKLLEKLGDKASVYEGLEDKAIKRLYYPTVVFVKNGEITDYIEGTVESQEDPYTPFTKNQRQELKDKYKSAINNLLSCDQDSKC